MNIKIGKKLREMRKQKGWTQEQVADSLYLSQSAYACIENGESCSWANNLVLICKVFEITPEELVKNNLDEISYSEKRKKATLIMKSNYLKKLPTNMKNASKS